MEKKTSNFSGQLGFVLAAAGSAVGVGKPLAVPVSCSIGWRRSVPACLSGTGADLRIYAAYLGYCYWAAHEKGVPSVPMLKCGPSGNFSAS